MADSAGEASGGSITRFLLGLRQGSDSAFTGIVRRLRPRVLGQVRRRLGTQLARAVDAEELAMEAFASLWRCLHRVREQPLRLDDRNDLLRILADITLQKVGQARRHHTRQKRDVRRTVREADMPQESEGDLLLSGMPHPSPPPEWHCHFEDVKAAWLADLSSRQQEIVCLRLDGYRNDEIALRLGVSLRSVERQVSAVRSRWQEQATAFGYLCGDA